MAMRVEGKTAILTGAGSGITLCFAELLLSKGCNVVIADLTLRPESEALISRYSLVSSGARAVFQRTDVADWAQMDKVFELATSCFGGADIVCPGAGVYEPTWSNFWQAPGTMLSRDDPAASRYRTLDVNITHPIRLTQLSIAHFLSHKKPGVVVHISSVAAQVPFFPTPLYVASKHALSGFVRSLSRLESPPPSSNLPKIRVNAVAPARILTPLWTESPDKMKMVYQDDPGWTGPEEVAKVMLELVEKEENVGGTIVEVGERVRVVEAFGDPGPYGAGNGVEHDVGVESDMWASLEGMYGKR